MNSRSSVNENLVKFPAELPTLNQIEAKDGLLSFSFDHIYACHSENAERRPTQQLDKEVEVSTHCVVDSDEEVLTNTTTDIASLNERLAAAETKNKKLNELVISHLDLIQQQNDELTKKEKLFQALKQENDTLKSRLNRMDRRVTLNQRHSVHSQPPPLVIGVKKQTSKHDAPSLGDQITPAILSDLLTPDTKNNPYVFDNCDKVKKVGQNQFEQNRDLEKDVPTYSPSKLGASSNLDKTSFGSPDFTMIESKRSFIKKELSDDTLTDPLFPVTSKSNSTVIQRMQRSRRKPTSTSSATSLSRAPKSSAIKVEPTEPSNPYDEDNIFDRNYTVNKKSKMINTYTNKCSRNGNLAKKMMTFSGSLCDRLQLIDTTPTGEDPYQLGEADMREQSPIPKLMLQKTNTGRMKVCSTDTSGTVKSRRIYEPPIEDDDDDDLVSKVKLNRYNLQNTTYMHPSEIKKEPDTDEFSTIDEPDLDIVKTETEIDWSMYTSKSGAATSLCDFSYGETPNNLASRMIPLDSVEFQNLFKTDSNMYKGTGKKIEYSSSTASAPRPEVKKRVGRNLLLSPNSLKSSSMPKPQDKRARKRAFSTTGLLKTIKSETAQKIPGPPKPKLVKGKDIRLSEAGSNLNPLLRRIASNKSNSNVYRRTAVCRGKKMPLPGMETKRPYHTLVGDPDISWYLGLDPDVKPEDIEQPGAASLEATVEVPRWREKPTASIHSTDGTEDLDDKVFEKRHQKFEAEERRQLRWHMRRIREQRHVERLRQRQRDSWCSSSGRQPPSAFTIWQQPQRDVRFIEITETLPVTAFGEAMPAVPQTDFVLPWVRASKALKRSNRSKTLH